jgi:PhzF family phenazine biosynthesis protein
VTTRILVRVVRVFTNESGEHGNELGIVSAGTSTAGREQEIAARLGFSETVFIEPRSSSEGSAVARVRIFTPAVELPPGTPRSERPGGCRASAKRSRRWRFPRVMRP